MTRLRQRMLNDMTVRGLAENTKRSYLSAGTGLARQYRLYSDNQNERPYCLIQECSLVRVPLPHQNAPQWIVDQSVKFNCAIP